MKKIEIFLNVKSFSFVRSCRSRKSANSEWNLYCNKRCWEKYLTRFEVDIAKGKKGKPKRKAKNFLHWNVYLDEICLHSSFHIALNKLIPCFFPACRFTLIELFSLTGGLKQQKNIHKREIRRFHLNFNLCFFRRQTLFHRRRLIYERVCEKIILLSC